MSACTDIQMNPENDPCDYGHHISASTSPRHQLYDSDPEEADIDEHTPTWFIFGRNLLVDPDHRHLHHHYGPPLDIVIDLLNGFEPRAPGGNGSFSSGPIEREQPAEQSFGPHIHRTSFIREISTITITSSPSHATRTGPPAGQAGAFQEYAQPLLQRLELPGGLRSTPRRTTIGADEPFLTLLMEAYAHSNAATPAIEEALKSLEHKPVDKDMLGPEGKTQCTICIDEMEEGSMATLLPCEHWYHEECVILWLKEHNTCPICRTSIEKTDRTGDNSSGRQPASRARFGAQFQSAQPIRNTQYSWSIDQRRIDSSAVKQSLAGTIDKATRRLVT